LDSGFEYEIFDNLLNRINGVQDEVCFDENGLDREIFDDNPSSSWRQEVGGGESR
jgi:hypothetical protein